MALPGFDLLTKAARLLVGRRYTSTDLGDSQESFTSTIQIGYDEIWAETRSIPTSSLPYYNLPSNSTTSSLGVVKYWYKWPLTVANNTTLTASSVWFFLNPSGSNSGVGSQLIQSGQQTNFISPKYSEVSLTNYYTDGDYNPGSAGYNIALFSSPNGSTFTRLDASASYQFDYKTGILQFTTKTVPTNRIYATVYQYIGKTLADGSDMTFTNVTASNISASGYITASSIYAYNLFSNNISSSTITSSIVSSSLGLFDVITASNALIKNNLWVDGNIYASVFSASNIYITSSQLVVTDNIITLNALSPYVRYTGIEMYDSGSGTLSSLLWDSENNYFFVSSSDSGYARQVILGPDFEQSLTPGYLALISSSNSITSSIIRQTNNTIIIEGNISASSFTSSISNGIGFMGTSSYSVSSSYTISASYTSTSSYSTYAETASLSSFSQNAQDILIYVKNTSGAIIPKGKVVRIVGADNSSNNATIELADFRNENNSANTLGFTNEIFSINGFGYVMTEGKLTTVNTSDFTSGDLLYLSSSGTITTTVPIPPNHGVRLGQVIRSQNVNGSIYVRIDNGAELDELHDVLDTSTTSSYGDLLVKSGSVWINSKNLTGSYTVTGSFSGQSGSFIYFNLNNTGSAPSSPDSVGRMGEIRLDNNFIYIYTNERWVRSPLAQWTT